MSSPDMPGVVLHQDSPSACAFCFTSKTLVMLFIKVWGNKITSSRMLSSSTMFKPSDFRNGICSQPTLSHGTNFLRTAANVPVVASADVSERHPLTSEGTIRYIFQVKTVKKNGSYKPNPLLSEQAVINGVVNHGLNIRSSIRPIGTINNDSLSVALSGVFKKMTPLQGDATFDMRSLMYLCGYMVAHNGTPEPYTLKDYDVNALTVKSLHTHNVGDLRGHFIINYALYADSNEYGTLLAMLQTLGVSEPLTTDEAAFQVIGKLQNVSGAAYAMKLASIIYNQAILTQTGAQHALAYLRGMANAVTLLSHSDEGGFARELLQTADYPPPSGIITVRGSTEFFGTKPDVYTSTLNHKSVLAAHTARSIVLLATMCACADPGSTYENMDNITPLVLYTSEAYPDRPGHWLGIESAVLRWATNMQELMQKHLKLDSIIINDSDSYMLLVKLNAANRHLTLPDGVIVDEDNFAQHGRYPFFWVEPSPFLAEFGMNTVYYSPGNSVPVLEYTGLQRNRYYRETRFGSPLDGSFYLVQPKAGQSFRSMGLFYLYSKQMNPRDGLANMTIVRSDGIRKNFDTFELVSPTATNLAAARWVTPDNCIPHPGHGLSTGHQLLKIAVTDRSYVYYPAANWMEKHPTVEILFGIPDVSSRDTIRSQRSVPNDKAIGKELRKYINRNHRRIDDDEFMETCAAFSGLYMKHATRGLESDVDAVPTQGVEILSDDPPDSRELQVKFGDGDINLKKFVDSTGKLGKQKIALDPPKSSFTTSITLGTPSKVDTNTQSQPPRDIIEIQEEQEETKEENQDLLETKEDSDDTIQDIFDIQVPKQDQSGGSATKKGRKPKK